MYNVERIENIPQPFTISWILTKLKRAKTYSDEEKRVFHLWLKSCDLNFFYRPERKPTVGINENGNDIDIPVWSMILDDSAREYF